MAEITSAIENATNIFLEAVTELGSLKEQIAQLIAEKAAPLQQIADLQGQLAAEVQKNSADQTAINAANDLATQGQAAFDQYKQGEESQKSALNDAIASLQKKISDLTVAPALPAPPVDPSAPVSDSTIVA